jgi:hypothetical protein
VLAVCTPLDADWANWPAELSYVPSMLDMARYMARRRSDDGNLRVAQPIRRALDPGRYKPAVRARFRRAIDDAKPETSESLAAYDETAKQLQLNYVETTRAGLYEIELSRFDGQREPYMYAVNVDPSEGDLTPIAADELKRQLGDARVAFVDGAPTLANGAENAKREFWFPILIGLVGVLGIEQFLAWWFGSRR